MATRETPVLLLHGYWHGAWCWSEVLARLTAAGTRALAVDMAAGATTLTADGWGSVPRTYVVCTRDRALQPAMQRKFVELADAAFPGNPTNVHTLDSSHSPFLSMPGELTGIILKI